MCALIKLNGNDATSLWLQQDAVDHASTSILVHQGVLCKHQPLLMVLMY